MLKPLFFHILLIESDPKETHFIRENLAIRNLYPVLVTAASNFSEGLRLAGERSPDIILLNPDLKDSPGTAAALQALSANSPGCAVIILGKSGEGIRIPNSSEEKVQGCLVLSTRDALFLMDFLLRALSRKWKQDMAERLETEEKLKTAIQDQLKNEHRLREALAQLQDLNLKLKTAQDQLIQAEKIQSLGRLAAGLAHEVKNPLAILLQGVEYLSQVTGDRDSSIRQVLADMMNAIERADGVIKGLLDYASPTQLNMQPVDPHRVLDDAIRLLNPLLKKSRVRIHKDYGKNLPQLIWDQARMQQAFVNILSNAIYAMPDGGKITVTTRRSPGPEGKSGGIIMIEDTGPGIPEDLLNKIFDPFLTTRRGQGGTGLGLSVVLGILELHQGQIKIENRKPHGVCVTLKL